MAKISIKNVATAIYESAKGKSGGELEKSLQNSVEFLAKKNLLSKAPEILKQLEEVQNADLHIVSAKVGSPTPISKGDRDSLKEILAKRYKAKEVTLSFQEDSTLLGGIRIEGGGEVIDLSLRNKINQLQTYLLT